MTVASEISRLQDAKADIKSAIESKGVTVGSGVKLDEYASCINSISSGGSFAYLYGDGSDGNCTIQGEAASCNNVFLEAKEWNFNNLTICPGTTLWFCGQGVPILKIKGEFLNCGTINTRNPLLTTTCSYCISEHDIVIQNQCNCLASAAQSIINGYGCYGGAQGSRAGKGGNYGTAGGNAECGCIPNNRHYCSGANGGAAYGCNGGGGGGAGSTFCYTSSTCYAPATGGAATATKGGDGGYGACTTGGSSPTGGGGGGGGFGRCCGGKGGDGGFGSYCGGNGGNGGNSYYGIAGNGGNGGGAGCRCTGGTGGKGGDSYYGNGGNGGTGGYAQRWGGPGGVGGNSVFGNAGNGGNGPECREGGRGGSSVYGNGGNGGGGCATGGAGCGMNGGTTGSGGHAWQGIYGLGLFANTFRNCGTILACGGCGGTGGNGSNGGHVYLFHGNTYGKGTVCICGGCGGASNGTAGSLFEMKFGENS